MQCKNHPEQAATIRCAGCAESFCENCVLDLAGQHYCGSCKIMALGDRQLVAEQGTVPCKEATSALTFSIIGMVLCSVVVSLWGFGLVVAAIVTALKARTHIASDLQLTGSGKATAALIVSGAALANALINVIGMVQRQG